MDKYIYNTVAFMAETIKERLLKTLKMKGISIPKFANDTGIPKDRVYKWFQQGTNPKPEDSLTVEKWINEISDTDEVSVAEASPLKNGGATPLLPSKGKLTIDDYITLLKEQNEKLTAIIEANLIAIQANLADINSRVKESQQVQEGLVYSSLAHFRTVLRVLAKQDGLKNHEKYLADANKEQSAIEALGVDRGKEAAAHS